MRRNRRAFEREVNAVERNAARRENVVSKQLAGVSNRVEEAVQVGVATGERLASRAKGVIA